MKLSIVIEEAELLALVSQFAPLRLHFTPRDEDRRWLELAEPKHMDIVAKEGLRLVSHGKLRYAIAGTRPEITIEHVSLMCRPYVTSDDSGLVIDFALEVEALDIAKSPGFVDATAAALLNGAVTPEATNMRWRVQEMLSKAIPLPERLEPMSMLTTKVSDAQVQVDAAKLVVALEVIVSAVRHSPVPKDSDFRLPARQ